MVFGRREPVHFVLHYLSFCADYELWKPIQDNPIQYQQQNIKNKTKKKHSTKQQKRKKEMKTTTKNNNNKNYNNPPPPAYLKQHKLATTTQHLYCCHPLATILPSEAVAGL